MITDEFSPAADPLALFTRWLADARAAEAFDATAMTLATADAAGAPSARVVLLKEADERGFVFYTNFESNKGQDLAIRPRAALCFYWPALARQIRLSGAVERVSDAEADAYFATRPRDSQISACVSHQSRQLADRGTFERAMEAFAAAYAGRPVPRPSNWGGFRVVPDRYEFWRARPGRSHDRLKFERVGREWRGCLLYP